MKSWSEEFLENLRKKHHAERVIVELNGMHQAADFYLKTPDTWQIAQEVMFADANTFLSYNQNMRQLTVDKLAGAELVVFNRMAPGTDVMPFIKSRARSTAGLTFSMSSPTARQSRTISKTRCRSI